VDTTPLSPVLKGDRFIYTNSLPYAKSFAASIPTFPGTTANTVATMSDYVEESDLEEDDASSTSSTTSLTSLMLPTPDHSPKLTHLALRYGPSNHWIHKHSGKSGLTLILDPDPDNPLPPWRLLVS